MLEIYEQSLLEHFSKKYSTLFNADENQDSIWKRLLKLQFPKLQLITEHGGFNLGDQHLSILIFELGRLERSDIDILNKILFIDTVNYSMMKCDDNNLLNNYINNNLITYIIAQNQENKVEPGNFILNGHIATIAVEKINQPIVVGIIMGQKIYYFDLPTSREIKIIKSNVMGIKILSLIATTLELKQSKLILSCKNQNSEIIAERFYRFLYVYMLGICSKIIELLKSRILTRRQFSKKISEFQMVRFKFSRIYAEHQILMAQLNYIKEHAGTSREQLLLTKAHLHNCMKTGMQYFGAYGLLNESGISTFYQKGALMLVLITQLLGEE